MPVPWSRYSRTSNGSPSYYCSSSATLTMFLAAQTAAVKPTSQTSHFAPTRVRMVTASWKMRRLGSNVHSTRNR
eukprot:2616453-Rhodomonas_salina.1